ncbi:MAG: UDP-2,3-diacylglucosamine diphosphatase [Bacteroidetes bacterium]|nr:UDP-2,3-diacylglucosamine diphosphatase [Bacteroidota bacterium]
MNPTRIYFISDFHLGAPDSEKSLIREKRIVRWLDTVQKDASEIYLMGDIFDFWFEYKHAVPRGYVRLLGKLAELSDKGIKLHYFTGNHDMWVFDYLPKEIGLTIYREPVTRTIGKHEFYIGHGDGLGPGDHGYKFIKKVFANKICQWMFARLHPNFGIPLALYFSRKSRIATGISDEKFLGEENEWLIIYCKELLQKKHFDFLIFGHRHLPLDIRLGDTSRYINLGEWINYNTYAVYDGKELQLLKFEG